MDTTLKFVIDNDISPGFASSLGDRGFDATHVRAYGMSAAGDEEILARAAIEGRVVVTQDSDFTTIMALKRLTQPSVVYFRTSRKSQRHLLPIFLANLPTFAEDLALGAVVVIEDTRIRIRRLPILPEE